MVQDDRLESAIEIGLDIGLQALDQELGTTSGSAWVGIGSTILLKGFYALLKELGIDTAGVEVKANSIGITIRD